MLRLLVLTCLLATALGRATRPFRRTKVPTLDGRIVGGTDANIEDYPYQLSLMWYGQHNCGASAISTSIALTAAHCIDGVTAQETSIRAGSDQLERGGTVLDAADIIEHPQFDYFTFDHDVALIPLRGELALGSAVALIGLAPDDYVPAAGAPVVVSGWGTLHSGDADLPTQLQVVTVPVVSNAECNVAYDGEITDRMLCAGEAGKDSCQGDSGGPVVENGVQIGIVSWGNGCALPGYPGVYSSVGALRSWIRQNSGV